jgi:hypothetical protein
MTLTPQQIKRALMDAGFEVFRTRAEEISLAERVRENLIMDSGVRLVLAPTYEVRVVFRAQQTQFPESSPEDLFNRARALSTPAQSGGFRELETRVLRISDPVDKDKTLDTHFEVILSRPAQELADAMEGLRYALSLERTVGGRRGE